MAGTSASHGAEKWLTGLFAHELKMDIGELRPDKAFQDYGIDSIMITQLLRPISKSLGKDIDPSILFEYSTVRTFTSWLQATYPGELAAVTAGGQAQAPIASEDVQPPAGIPSGNGQASPRRSEPSPTPAGKPAVAVVGMSCRFPGADDLGSYWQLLQGGGQPSGPYRSIVG